MANLRINQMPQRVDGPLGTPEGVRIVVVELGLAVFVERYLSDARAGSGHVHVFAVHIADDPPPLQGMPQVGVKPLAFLGRSPVNLDATEPGIPIFPGFADYPVEIPMGQLHGKVEAGLFYAD